MSVPGSVLASSMYRAGAGAGARSLASLLHATTHHDSTLPHYTMAGGSPSSSSSSLSSLYVPCSASPVLYEPPLSGPGVSGGGGGGGGGDPLLDNSNLCDILMLERALGGYQHQLTPDLEQCLLCLTRPILFRFKL